MLNTFAESDASNASDLFFHVHVCGIGGIGTSGIALLLSDLGFRVTGSDLRPSELTQILESRQIAIAYTSDSGLVHGATCLIRPASFPPSHPELEYARNAGIPVFDRTHALAEICRRYADRTTLCLGTCARALGARLIASAIPDAGWCAGAALNDGSLHAKFGKHLIADIDERDLMTDPGLCSLFPNADFVITDWQHPAFGYYPNDLDEQTFVRECPAFGTSRIVYPVRQNTRGIDVITSDPALRGQKTTRFEYLAEKAPKLYCAETAQSIPISDGPGEVTAYADVWQYLRMLAEETGTSYSIPRPVKCIGWFEDISDSGRRVYDIRMHPVNISAALEALAKRIPEARIRLAIRPFVSTLRSYSVATWCQAFRMADRVDIVTPPYPGCTSEDCANFAAELQEAGIRAECVDAQILSQIPDNGDALLAVGAPDMRETVRQTT